MNKIVQILADAFNVAPEAIKPDSGPGTLEGWDSLSHLQMVLRIEEAFDVRFTTPEIAGLISPTAIKAKVKEKGGQL